MTPQPERLSQYQSLRNVGTDFTASSSQARRRQDALARQKEQRRLAFSLAREGLDDVLDDLDLSDSSSDDVEQADTTVNSHKALPEDGRFEDANESPSAASVEDTFHKHEQPADNSNATSFNTNQKPRRHMPKRIRKKYKIYANRLMQGEILYLEGEGLPSDLAGEWLALGPIPKGKRCMAVTFVSTRTSSKGKVTNTILLARTTGKPLLRQNVPALPPNCVLDCIYVKEAAALFVLDVLQWKGQSVAEGEADFRIFWRDSMLAELPAQTIPTWTKQQWKGVSTQAANGDMQEDISTSNSDVQRHSRPSHLLLLPTPCLAASLDFPQQLLTELVGPCLVNETADATLLVVSDMEEHLASRQLVPHRINYQIDGLSLLLKSAAYESGLTPLAAWVPREQVGQLAQCLSPCS